MQDRNRQVITCPVDGGFLRVVRGQHLDLEFEWIWGQQLSPEKHPKLLAASHACSISEYSGMTKSIFLNIFQCAAENAPRCIFNSVSNVIGHHMWLTEKRYRLSRSPAVPSIQSCSCLYGPIKSNYQTTLPIWQNKKKTDPETSPHQEANHHNLTTLLHLKDSGSNQVGCGRCCPVADCRASQANRAAALSGHSSCANGSWGAKDAALKAPSNLRSDKGLREYNVKLML